MSTSLRSRFVRSVRRAWARRTARLASLRRADEHLTDVAERARDDGDGSWRHALPQPRRGIGGGI